MDSFVTDTQALVKCMLGQTVINDRSHQAFLSAGNGEITISIPAIVLFKKESPFMPGVNLNNRNN
jgi:hypothetical protein